jgi:hypothetical protein
MNQMNPNTTETLDAFIKHWWGTVVEQQASVEPKDWFVAFIAMQGMLVDVLAGNDRSTAELLASDVSDKVNTGIMKYYDHAHRTVN